jgi:hypothetical protein
MNITYTYTYHIILRMKKVREPYSSDVVILTVKRLFLSSYFRSLARKGPGTEEQGSPVAGPVCDRSSPGQDRRRLEHAGIGLESSERVPLFYSIVVSTIA